MRFPLSPHPMALLACAVAASGATPPARAGDVVVQVTGTRTAGGQIGCALFAGEQGFPMDNGAARQLWLAAEATTTTCRFTGVAPGRYAVSVAHDLNGNRRVDTNFLGIPTEGWGVSNNVVPTLRAPRFDEAAFRVEGDAPLVLDVRLAH